MVAMKGASGTPGAQGATHGNPRHAPAALAQGRPQLATQAKVFAANLLPIILALRAAGVTGLRGLAHALLQRGVRSARPRPGRPRRAPPGSRRSMARVERAQRDR